MKHICYNNITFSASSITTPFNQKIWTIVKMFWVTDFLIEWLLLYIKILFFGIGYNLLVTHLSITIL